MYTRLGPDRAGNRGRWSADLAERTLSVCRLHKEAQQRAEGPRPKRVESRPKRLTFFYVPIGGGHRGFLPGAAQAGLPAFNGDFGVIIRTAAPVGSHPTKLTPLLEPLENIRPMVALVTGLNHSFQIGTDVRVQRTSCFLSSVTPFTVGTSA